ncbi:MAG TPA: hypothetical protein VF440_14425, partial [Novosphingobium sp.]
FLAMAPVSRASAWETSDGTPEHCISAMSERGGREGSFASDRAQQPPVSGRSYEAFLAARVRGRGRLIVVRRA